MSDCAHIRNTYDKAQLARLHWARLGDIPIDDNECIDMPFTAPLLGTYPAGTHREEIWHDFEGIYGIAVHDLMFPDTHDQR